MQENGSETKWTRSQKKARKNDYRDSDKVLFELVRPERFELPARWFEASCSVP